VIHVIYLVLDVTTIPANSHDQIPNLYTNRTPTRPNFRLFQHIADARIRLI
jgi:hypothetical protein